MVCKHGDDSEGGAQGEGASVAHVEAGGWNIEPEEGEEGATNYAAEGGEDKKAFDVGDDAECAERHD